MTERDPASDAAFDTLFARWTGDHLGWEKDEGIGILFKEGGYAELLGELHRRAPRTMASLAERVADASGEAPAEASPAGRLMLDFVRAMAITDAAERRQRFDALDLLEPAGDYRSALESLDPPMPARYARRIEEWLDMAANIEARAAGEGAPEPREPSLVGRTVAHAKFGRGVVRAVEPGENTIATVEFEAHGVKRLALRFLELR